MGVVDQINALGMKVGDTIEGTESGNGWFNTTRLKLLWMGNRCAVFDSSHSSTKTGGNWTKPREESNWDLSCRDWKIIERGSA